MIRTNEREGTTKQYLPTALPFTHHLEGRMWKEGCGRKDVEGRIRKEGCGRKDRKRKSEDGRIRKEGYGKKEEWILKEGWGK
jgi:hypothetical protein